MGAKGAYTLSGFTNYRDERLIIFPDIEPIRARTPFAAPIYHPDFVHLLKKLVWPKASK